MLVILAAAVAVGGIAELIFRKDPLRCLSFLVVAGIIYLVHVAVS